MNDATKPDPHAKRQTDLNIAFARKDWNMDTQPARHVEEPEIVKTMRKNLDGWDNRAVCAYIDALLADTELAKDVEHWKAHYNAACDDLGVSLAQHEETKQRAEQAESRALAAQKDAERYRYLRRTRAVLLLTGFFGNGCINKRIDDLDAAIDAAAK